MRNPQFTPSILAPRLFLLFLILGLSFSSYGQYVSGFQFEYFFGNLPNASTEAMGKSEVALGGSIGKTFMNAAATGTLENQEFHFSTSGPYYVLNNSNYYYVGYGKRISDKLVMGVSFNQLAVGLTTFEVNIGSNKYPLDEPKTTNIGLNASYQLINNLNIGLNINQFRWKLFNDVEKAKTMHVDLGALYVLPLSEAKNSKIQFGTSVSNITTSEITWTAPDSLNATNELPMVLRAGLCFKTSTKLKLPKAEEGSLDYTFTTQYQNLLNSEFYGGWYSGAEVVVYDVLALRIGYFKFKVDNYGFSNNKTAVSDLTYGFGFKIPLKQLSKGKIPFNSTIDYTSLEPASYVKQGSRLPNFRAYTLNLNWPSKK